MIYRKDFTLHTNVVGFDNHASGGWIPDCGGKQDFDPCFVLGDSRVYPDGAYICAIWIGMDDIVRTDVLQADSVDEAKKACELWMQEKGKIIRSAVEAALKAEHE